MTIPSIDVTIVGFNEEDILPFTFRHYCQFARRIRYWDAFSTDRSREIAKSYGVEIFDWSTDGLNDMSSKILKSNDWKYPNEVDRADWHITADSDELIFFPEGVENTLANYDARQIPFVRTRGFEMLSDTMPDTTGQIYDQIYMGGVDDRWYGKPSLFAPKRLLNVDYEVGAHACTFTKINGYSEKITGGGPIPTPATEPPTYLLHYHHIGGVDRIARRYDATRQRLSKLNVNNRWGNFDPGIVHAQDKRKAIMSTLKRVVQF